MVKGVMWKQYTDSSYFYLDSPDEDANWQATDLESLALLQGLVRSLRPEIIVETGTHIGVGTAYLNEYMPPTSKLFTVDVKKYPLHVPRLAYNSRIKFITGDSTTVHWAKYIDRGIPDMVDFAYIDCEDRGAAARNLLPFMRKGATIALHDVNFPIVFDKFMEVMQKYLSEPFVVKNSRGLALFKVL